jgi:hypothetical protein
MVDTHHQQWNARQQALQKALQRPAEHPELVEIFLAQHGMLHAAQVSAPQPVEWSFDDELWAGLSEQRARQVFGEHSIAWMMWHCARCEDITLNLLVAGTPQVLHNQGWQARMKIDVPDTGNSMTPAEIAVFSAAIDLLALRGYRSAVGCRTREIVTQVPLKDWKNKVDPARIQRVLAEQAVLENETWLTDYWGGRTWGGLLLMPPTRHLLVHLNEAMKAKKKRGL